MTVFSSGWMWFTAFVMYVIFDNVQDEMRRRGLRWQWPIVRKKR